MDDIIGLTRNSGGQAIGIDVGYSDNEHIEDLTMFCKGWQKMAPQFGAEAGIDIKASELDRLKSELHRNLEADGANSIDIWVEDDNINVNAQYN